MLTVLHNISTQDECVRDKLVFIKLYDDAMTSAVDFVIQPSQNVAFSEVY